MVQGPRVDHECVADHCLVCCPRAQGWNDGYESARQIYKTESRMRLLDADAIMGPLVVFVIILTIALVAHKQRISSLESKAVSV